MSSKCVYCLLKTLQNIKSLLFKIGLTRQSELIALIVIILTKFLRGGAGVKKNIHFLHLISNPPPLFYVIKIVPAAATCGGGWNLWDPPPPHTHTRSVGGGTHWGGRKRGFLTLLRPKLLIIIIPFPYSFLI